MISRSSGLIVLLILLLFTQVALAQDNVTVPAFLDRYQWRSAVCRRPGGTVRATCDVANPGRCAFYLSSRGITESITPFIYFAYTTARLIVKNTSDDQWMLTGEIGGTNQNHPNPDSRLTLGDPGLFPNQDILGDVLRLGPGQYLFFTDGSPESDSPPQDCYVVARLDIAPDLIFWSQDFSLDSVMDGQRRTCPAAEAGKLTLCVMPR